MRYFIFIFLTLLLRDVRSEYSFITSTNNGEIALVGFAGSGASLDIPSQIGGLPVTSIGNGAFTRCTALNVTIPDSIRSIGVEAFYAAKATNAIIGNSVTNIGTRAFYSSTLKTVAIGANVADIGEEAFYETSLSSVTFPDSLRRIGPRAFMQTDFSSVTIPAGVTNIGAAAFGYCLRLGAINVSGDNSSYSSVDGVLFDRARAIIAEYPAGKTASSYSIPAGVTVIGEDAFFFCYQLTQVTIPNGVARIASGAFWGSGLTDVAIPNTVIEIGDAAFEATSLSSVSLPSSVLNLGEAAFAGCGQLLRVVIPKSVKAIANGAFSGCSSLTDVMMEDGGTLMTIGDAAFSSCRSLTSITIPDSVVSIGYAAFDSSGLTNLTVGRGVTNIADSAFSQCLNLVSAYFLGNAPKIGSVDFNGDQNVTTYYTNTATGWSYTFWGYPKGPLAVVLAPSDPPTVITPPTSQTNSIGVNVTLKVVAIGTPPLSYQWFHGESPLEGATNSSHTITNIQGTDGGSYSVKISNSFGSTTSSAFLGVADSSIVAWDSANGEFDPRIASLVRHAPIGLPTVVALSAGATHALALYDEGRVFAWGDNSSGQTNVPTGLSNVVAIAAGNGYSLALKQNGSIVAWGSSSAGASIPPGLSNMVAIAASGQNSAALKGDGTVVAWGMATYGATNVPANLENVIALAVNGRNSYCIALNRDGTVTSWGQAQSERATNQPTNLTNAVAVATGGSDIWALKSDGTVSTWNSNGIQVDFSPPGLTNAVAIAADMALLKNGTIITWGNRQAADATNAPPGLTNVVAIAANEVNYDLALVRKGLPAVLGPVSQEAYSGAPVVLIATATGPLPLSYQWQFNGANILGATNSWFILTNSRPAHSGKYRLVASNGAGNTFGPDADVVVKDAEPVIWGQPVDIAVPMGDNPTISITASGSRPLSYQWQFNGKDISDGTNTTLKLNGVQLSDAGTYAVVVKNDFGSITTSNCTLSFVPTSVVAWGLNDKLQAEVPIGLTNVIAVSAGANFSLALNVDGTVVAWGDNSIGQTNVPVSLTNIIAISAGAEDSLALKADGTVVQWGNVVQLAPPDLSNVVAIANGSSKGFYLAVTKSGRVVAWGNSVLTNVPINLTNVVAVAAVSGGFGGSVGAAVALKADQTVVAWGDSYLQNLPPNLTNVVAIGAGPYAWGCAAVKSDGSVQYWGYGTLPPAPKFTDAVAVCVSAFFGVVLKSDHTVAVWGDNTFGQANIPPGLTNVIGISAGYEHVVVLDPTGGAITLSVGFGGDDPLAQFTLNIGPPAALTSVGGGSWNESGLTGWFNAPLFTHVYTLGATASVLFNASSNWNTPPSTNLVLTLGSNTVYSANFTLAVKWPEPAPVKYGTALTTSQLNASTIAPQGAYSYSPPLGSVLSVGTNLLSVVFTPTDTVNYGSASSTGNVNLVVLPSDLTVTASNALRVVGEPNPVFGGTITGITNGDHISASYLCSATLDSPPGIYEITPVLVDSDQKLSNYHVTRNNGSLQVVSRPAIKIESYTSDSITLSWNSTPGHAFQLQSKTDLNELDWVAVGSAIPGGDSTITTTEPLELSKQRFFRLILQP